MFVEGGIWDGRMTAGISGQCMNSRSALLDMVSYRKQPESINRIYSQANRLKSTGDPGEVFTLE
jgi:hypothetical protein